MRLCKNVRVQTISSTQNVRHFASKLRHKELGDGRFLATDSESKTSLTFFKFGLNQLGLLLGVTKKLLSWHILSYELMCAGLGISPGNLQADSLHPES